MTKQIRLGLVLLVSTMSTFAAGDEVIGQLRTSTVELMDTLRQEETTLRQNPEQLRQVIKASAVKHFDMVRFSKMSLGKHWRRLDRKQFSTFVQEFEKLLLKMYGNVLLEHIDNKITWSRRPGQSDRYVVVRANVAATPPIKVDFYMMTSKRYAGYRVYDIKVEGVSLVVNFRSTFGNIIQSQGFEALINELRRKNG